MEKNTKSRAIHRAKIIKGQLEGLEKQINDGSYCMDILTQSLAIQKSLSSLSKLVVANHIETHIQQMFTSGAPEQIETAVAELSRLYELTNVRGK